MVSRTNFTRLFAATEEEIRINIRFLILENIMWLSVDNIQEKDAGCTVIADLPDLPHLVGSGQSVGGVVSETVGAGNINENTPLQVTSRRY